MVNWILTQNGDGTVNYLMKQKNCNFAGKTKFENALWMLKQGGEIRASGEFPMYPLTSDGVYFFAGEFDDQEPPEIGADGLPLLAVAEKPKRKKRVERPTEGRTEGASADGVRAAPPKAEAARRARNSPPSEATGERRLKDVVCE